MMRPLTRAGRVRPEPEYTRRSTSAGTRPADPLSSWVQWARQARPRAPAAARPAPGPAAAPQAPAPRQGHPARPPQRRGVEPRRPAGPAPCAQQFPQVGHNAVAWPPPQRVRPGQASRPRWRRSSSSPGQLALQVAAAKPQGLGDLQVAGGLQRVLHCVHGERQPGGR